MEVLAFDTKNLTVSHSATTKPQLPSFQNPVSMSIAHNGSFGLVRSKAQHLPLHQHRHPVVVMPDVHSLKC